MSRDARKPVFEVSDQPAHTPTDESYNLQFNRNCAIRVAKTKALISFAVTANAKLTCAFIFAKAKSRFLITRLICESNIKVKGHVWFRVLFTKQFYETMQIMRRRQTLCLHGPLYNTIRYSTVLDITRTIHGPQ